MRKIYKYLSLLLLLILFESNAQTTTNIVPDQLLVKIKNEIAITPQGNSKNISIEKELFSIKSILSTFSLKEIDRPYIEAKNYPALQNVYLIKLNKPEQLEAMIESLKKDPSVEYVEKVAFVKASEHIPNDYSLNSSHLARVSAPNAWEITKGSSYVKIAIIDTGIDYNHPDLAANMDVANGYDFVSNDSDPINNVATEAHGTHVAGIAGAVSNNGFGVTSLAYNVKIIPIRILDENGDGNTVRSTSAIIWAANHGAHIINMSYGGHYGGTPTENSAVQYAFSLGCALVAAAGNQNTNDPSYPAAYPNVFSVANTTMSDIKNSSSNYGSWVKISAPGTIYSTTPNGNYSTFNGTSMASPIVASLMALIKAANPTFTAGNLISRVYDNADNIDYLNPGYVGQLGNGRINAIAALYGGSYCLANMGAYNASSLLGLGSVTINGTLQNGTNAASRDGKYSLFTNTTNPTDLNRGPNTFECVQFRGSYTNIVVGMWIDFNGNGQFEPSEKIYQGSPNSATSTTFNVPCNAATSRYRLRIRITDSQANIDPCNFYAMGDTKDYDVNLPAANPVAMSASSNITSPICAGSSVTLSFSGCAGGTMAWQDNASNVSPRVVTPTQTTIYKAECTKGGCVVDTKAIPVVIPPTGTQNSVIHWEKSFGGTVDDGFNHSVKTADGGYLLTGFSSSGSNGNKTQIHRGGVDGVLIKIDLNGNRVWEKVFGGVNDDYLYDIIPLSDNNFLICGWSKSGVGYEKQSINKGDVDSWIIKITPNGDIIWEVSLGSTAADYTGSLVTPTSDGGFIIGSSVGSTGVASVPPNGDRSVSLKSNAWDYWIFKIDANGQKVWDKVYGGLDHEFILGIEKATDNSGFYIVGTTNSASGAGSDITTSARHDYDGWLLKIDNNGNKIFDKTFSGGSARSPFTSPDYSNESLRKIKALPDGNYLIQGLSSNHAGNEKSENSMGGMDMWMIKIAPDGSKISDKVFGGINNEYEGDMIVLNDGNILLSISSNSPFNVDKNDALKGTSDVWMLKLDPNLNILWSENFGGAVGTDAVRVETFYNILNDGNDNFILTGWANETKGDRADAFGQNDAWVLKVNIPSITKPTISSNTTLVCSGEPITLTANGCTSGILWSNGATTNSVVVKPNSNDNTYKVNCLTNNNACIGLDSDVFRVNIAPSDLNLSGTAISGVKQAKGTIISHEIVNNGVNVNYKAGKSILLDKNQTFEAKAGSVFKAEIATCNFEEGMVGYYPFNGNVQDASGENRHGVLNGALYTKDRFGKSNAALSFDGIDDQVTLQYNYLGYQELTISAWINVKDLANAGQTILNGGGPFFVLSQQSNVGFGINTSTTEGGTSTGQLLILSNLPNNPKNTWAHILVKFKSGDSKYYLNGQIVGTNTQAYNFISYSGVLRIGIQNSFGTLANPFKGEIDDLRIYNRALSDAEVVALYKSEAPNPSLNSGLFANYKFDGNANDASGKGNNGTLIGGATFTTDRYGQANKALNFDGIDDRINIPNNNSVGGYNEMTMSIWFKHDLAPTSVGNFFSKWSGLTTSSYLLFLENRIITAVVNTSIGNVALTSPSTVSPNVWHHCVVTFDKSGMKLYLNGALINSTTSISGGNVNYSIHDLDMGTYNYNQTNSFIQFFKGAMDDAKLYNRALSPLEVIQLYDLEKP